MSSFSDFACNILELIAKVDASYWRSSTEMTKTDFAEECENRGMRIALIRNQKEFNYINDIRGKYK